MLLRPQHLSWWHHPPDAAADEPPAHADAAAARTTAASSAGASGEASGDASGEARGDVTVQFDLPPGAYATMALREVMRATPAPSPGHVRFGDAEGDGCWGWPVTRPRARTVDGFRGGVKVGG